MIIIDSVLVLSETVGKHLLDDRIQLEISCHIYYSSMKSAVNIGPVKKNTHSDEKKIEEKPSIKQEDNPQPSPLMKEENQQPPPLPFKEEEKTTPPPSIKKEEKSQQRRRKNNTISY